MKGGRAPPFTERQRETERRPSARPATEGNRFSFSFIKYKYVLSGEWSVYISTHLLLLSASSTVWEKEEKEKEDSLSSNSSSPTSPNVLGPLPVNALCATKLVLDGF